MTDKDLIFTEIRDFYKKREEDMLWYISNCFTKNEAIRHSENLLRMVQGVEGDIAEIKLKLLVNRLI